MAHYSQLTPEISVNEINSWFSNIESPKPALSNPPVCGAYRGKTLPSKSDFSNSNSTADCGFLRFEDEDSIAGTTAQMSATSIGGDMMTLDVDTMPPPLLEKIPSPEDFLDNQEIYEHYNFDHTYNTSYPILDFRKNILGSIDGNSVTVIQGSTGSGKTTQVPQFILDKHATEQKYCNIVVTQPRKIAAISLARRVCQERNWQVGGLVGYQVGLDKMTSQDTRITYMTTGVLLRHLIQAKHLNKYTHIILDEVHERDQETDFAMLLVRKLLWLNSKSVKVILMSATFDSEQFAKYFGRHTNGTFFKAPTINVTGKIYHVEESYVEDISFLGTMPDLNFDNPEVSEETYGLAARLIMQLDCLEDQERKTCTNGETIPRGSVLVFLPGIFQIREFANILEFERINKLLKIIPLHSTITLDEQGEVFLMPPKGFRKVILATNIAESSLTVPDIKYVIDFCLTKYMVCDMDTNYQSLRLQWTSKASGKQRAGRAGRVSNGRVYRLVTRDFWNNNISDYGIPELQRCSLESAVLKVKLLGLGAPKEILSLALSPPDLYSIGTTILRLKEIGALSTTRNLKRFDGDLTFVGQVLASLPIDMHLGKMVMLGFVFGCFQNCLIIAAALSKQSFFARPYTKQLDSFKAQLSWANSSFSDCIALLNAYQEWDSLTTSQQFRRKKQEKDWALKNFIQLRRLHEVHYLVSELQSRLTQFNIKSYDTHYWESEDHRQNEIILKAVMAGAFYPNYFEQTLTDEAASVKEMSMLDPSTTALVTGLPSGKGPLFKESLLQLTKSCGKQKAIYYDGSKAFIEFQPNKDLSTGNVYSGVYLACKLRDIMRPIQLLQNYDADLTQISTATRVSPFLYDPISQEVAIPELPKLGESVWLPVYVTHVCSGLEFWGYKMLEANLVAMKTIEKEISHSPTNKTAKLKEGTLVMARFDDGHQVNYYRALITKIFPEITVWFVDYGNTTTVKSINELKEMPDHLQSLPFQSIHFKIHGLTIKETISQAKVQSFLHSSILSSKCLVNLRIHSIVSEVVHVDVYTTNKTFINEDLVKQNFCVQVAEGKISQLNHNLWEMSQQKNFSPPCEIYDDQGDWKKVPTQMRKAISHPHKVTVQGPRNTFETSFTSVTNIGRMRNVSIERSGINGITINQHPTSQSRSMMVAGEVGVNQSGSTMIARNTTLMPDIPGLLPLLSLVFAPVVEFRVDAQYTHYTGAICGLGFIENMKGCFSVFSDHDVEVLFDVEFTIQDIIDVNALRMMVNIAVGGKDDIGSWSQSVIHKIQTKARQKLLGILSKKRLKVDPEASMQPYSWNVIREDRIVTHNVSDTRADRKDLYRLHDAVALREIQNVYN